MSLIASILLTIQLDSPLIGGIFSNPANTFPKLFSHNIFRAYPYFLPGCIAAVISVIGAVFGYVFLEEVGSPSQLHSHARAHSLPQTLPSKRRGLPIPKSITDEHQEQKSGPYTFRMLVSVPTIRALSFSGAGLSFTYTAFDVLFVLFCYSPLESGGLALSVCSCRTSLSIR